MIEDQTDLNRKDAKAAEKIPPKLKLSQIIDSPTSRDSRDSRATPVSEFNKTEHPILNPVGNVGKSYTKMHDPSSLHTRLTHPDQYRPSTLDPRRNPSGPRLKLSSERAAEREAADLKAGRGLRQAGEPVLRGDFERLFWSMFPEELRPACWNRYGDGNSPTVGNSLVIGDDGTVKWGEGSTLSVYGTAGLYKGVFLRGWSKASAAASWVAMTVAQEDTNPPAKLDTAFVDGVDAYPWYAWRPTWDYARAHA